MSNAAAAAASKPEAPQAISVEIKNIVRLSDLQPRNSINEATVGRYAEQMNNGTAFPPVKLHRVKGKLYLVDGWHRMAACERNGWEDVSAIIVEDVSHADTFLAAALANMQHGLQLKPSEYRNVFRMLIKAGHHKKGRKRGQWMSYAEIGAMVGKSKMTIWNWMKVDFPAVAAEMAGEEVGQNTEWVEAAPESESQRIQRGISDLTRQLLPLLNALDGMDKEEAIEGMMNMLVEASNPPFLGPVPRDCVDLGGEVTEDF